MNYVVLVKVGDISMNSCLIEQRYKLDKEIIIHRHVHIAQHILMYFLPLTADKALKQ